MDFQHGIIRRHRLERDIRVPTIACEFAWLCQWIGGSIALLLFNAADDTDLITELTACFCDGVDVKS